jgi:hypothetical protein
MSRLRIALRNYYFFLTLFRARDFGVAWCAGIPLSYSFQASTLATNSGDEFKTEDKKTGGDAFPPVSVAA